MKIEYLVFENLWQIVFGDANTSTITNRQFEETIAGEKKKIVDSTDSEIKILEDKFGQFTSGLMIEISLQEMLTLIPRKRKRADAYNSLAKILKAEYGVCLKITSRKSNNYDKQERIF